MAKRIGSSQGGSSAIGDGDGGAGLTADVDAPSSSVLRALTMLRRGDSAAAEAEVASAARQRAMESARGGNLRVRA